MQETTRHNAEAHALDEAQNFLAGAIELADDAVGVAHDALVATYRFMNRPIAALPHRCAADRQSCATDGRELIFTPQVALNSISGKSGLLARMYLHMTMHCLLRHPWPPDDLDDSAARLRYGLACDLAVAATLSQMETPVIAAADAKRDAELQRWVRRVAHPTAAEFYAEITRQRLGETRLIELSMLFGMDGHDLWLKADDTEPTADAQQQMAQLREQWEKIARQTEDDLASNAESAPEALSDALSHLEADPMGLEELLRAFTMPHEQIKANPDEFDYIYYTYGLRKYGNMPLIEPLEYSDAPELVDFVIALDSSGSIDRELAAAFVSKACGMLLAPGTLGERARVVIMQCDDAIREEVVVRRPADVERYLASFEVKGRGATDFRPVFDRIDALLADGTLSQVEGALYFTDGQGTFPEVAPRYDTAFVFVDQLAPTPPWATPVLTYRQELA